jgi:tetratricopeptide (TPR) repeat protein
MGGAATRRPSFFDAMNLPARSTLVPLALAAGALLPLAWISGSLAAHGASERAYDVSWVPEGRLLRSLSPGLRLSIANYYWLLTIQYIGDSRADQRGFEKLFPTVDLITDLDPRHGYAYQSAGIVLSTRGLLEESDRILKKGMEKGPGWWSYPFYIAFNHFFYRGDYAEAARWAQIAAKTPGASTNISHLALALEAKSGAPEEAVRFLDELRGVAKDDKTREALDEQYKLAVLQVHFARLDEAVQAFRARRGHAPARLEELIASGLLPSIPTEPFGGRYELRADGRVHSTGRDFRFAPAESWRAKRMAPPATPPPPPPPRPRGQQ